VARCIAHRDKVPNVRVNAAWAALALGQARLAPAHHAKLKAAMTVSHSHSPGAARLHARDQL
jgi:hypothetical protein